jgi:hypothetical protein
MEHVSSSFERQAFHADAGRFPRASGAWPRSSSLAPARGQRFLARAEVIHAGRRLSLCTAEVAAVDANQHSGSAGEKEL